MFNFILEFDILEYYYPILKLGLLIVVFQQILASFKCSSVRALFALFFLTMIILIIENPQDKANLLLSWLLFENETCGF